MEALATVDDIVTALQILRELNVNGHVRGDRLDRTHLDGLTGARTWCGHGVFAHNLVKITRLTAAQPA